MKKKTQHWISRYLNQEEIKSIEAAVAQAEVKTRGEIVPVIVRRSSTTGHVFSQLYLLLMTSGLLIFNFYSEQSLPQISFWKFLLAALVVYVVSLLLAKTSYLQRLLTPAEDRDAQVDARAELEFFESNIKNTQAGTGVLIFLSLMERRAVLLADQAIHEKVEKEIWQKVCDQLVQSARQGNLAEGMRAAVVTCGEILEKDFPANAHNPNELRNHLVFKDGI